MLCCLTAAASRGISQGRREVCKTPTLAMSEDSLRLFSVSCLFRDIFESFADHYSSPFAVEVRIGITPLGCCLVLLRSKLSLRKATTDDAVGEV